VLVGQFVITRQSNPDTELSAMVRGEGANQLKSERGDRCNIWV
jgi:hypothetical protein